MADSKYKAKSHLQTEKDPVWWDWWSENPIEIVLVVLFLVLFFALPRQGCGVTSDAPMTPPSATQQNTP
jgi:hypothetical protein